jgi:hypothetical protein
MISLAAAAVLVRDLTERHLDGAGAIAPAGRSRRAGPNASAPAGRSLQAPRTSRAAPAPSDRQGGCAPSHPGGPGHRVPRSA